MTDQQPLSDDPTFWNKRQKKSILPAVLGLTLLCLLLAYLFSHTAN